MGQDVDPPFIHIDIVTPRRRCFHLYRLIAASAGADTARRRLSGRWRY
jgi:hypothetical protein